MNQASGSNTTTKDGTIRFSIFRNITNTRYKYGIICLDGFKEIVTVEDCRISHLLNVFCLQRRQRSAWNVGPHFGAKEAWRFICAYTQTRDRTSVRYVMQHFDTTLL